MTKIIGIDIGGSTTKIVGFSEGQVFSPLLVRATDPVASVYGAFGKFLSENKLLLADIDRLMVTGVGASFITERLYGIPTGKVDEFRAIGMGGLFMSRLTNAIIVSMGTGTALVKADSTSIKHMGGTGVGGGTLLGLSNKMLNIRNFADLIEMAQSGNLANIDLTIGDISRDVLEGLPPETTASNFGKISDLATKSDIALGIINLVFQTIGIISIFAARIDQTKDIVLIGNLTNVPQSNEIFKRLGELFQVSFHLPNYAEYATAVGAAISYTENLQFENI
ncbi:MAG: Type II pantothenate kinase [candidate division WS2 bacterium]|uniref:Type II pantothenate kinase n=1 Tax=Psychracetigena formicireducens TaxID=2986056 RepID=A0A9E2BLM9_PSYF1|nr:Type II pantothenate kinase [Candidatus Psychracetigena formicireducens]MBT9145284.1 Type II pantothenate kinase [Candidatus Psychracetigena formicireducens]MBT9150345.1 Type II pantothenate kinase [Candidatus Psychracetigena formicireducens]